jgi:hypothetical protein
MYKIVTMVGRLCLLVIIGLQSGCITVSYTHLTLPTKLL